MSLLAPRRLLTLISVAAALVISGCADARGGTIPYDKPLAAPDEVKFQTLGADHKIAPTGKLSIWVFKMDDLFGDYDLDLAGTRIVGATFAKSEESLSGYGRYGYGYGYGYGARGRINRTDRIPQGNDASRAEMDA